MGIDLRNPHPIARVEHDSADAGWRSLRVLRQSLSADVDDVSIDPMDVQLLDVQVSGLREVQSRFGRRWRTAGLGPGSVSTTPPSRGGRLRWSSPDGVTRIEQVRVLIPATTTTRVAHEVWPGGSVPELPNALRFDDDVLSTAVVGAHRAAAAGAPEIYAAAAAELLTVHLLTVHGGAPAPPDPGRDEPRVRLALEFLRARATDPVTLADVADAVGLSRYHLLRLVRRHTGATPHQHLVRLRVEHARRLLDRTDLPVARVAHESGFGDHSHFARTFRRLVGESPSDYRRHR